MVKVGLISVGFEKFRMDIAQKYLTKSIELIETMEAKVISNEVIINSLDQLKQIQKSIINEVDMIVIQIGTFAMGEMVIELIEMTKDLPIFLWGFKDPIVNDFNTIPLNSLTGLNMFTSYLKRYDKTFSYAYDDFESNLAHLKLNNMIRAIATQKQLRKSKFGVIGTRAPGFYLSEVNHISFKKNVGPTIEYYSIGELVKQAENFPHDLVEKKLNEKFKDTTLKGLRIQLEKNVRVFLAIEELVKREKLDALTIKCWPEWQSLYQISVCPVLSLLNDEGYMTSCEGDIAGLATMYIQYLFTKKAPFFADLATISDNRLKAWHCGHMPMSLCDSPIDLIEHPTMKDGIGVAIQADMITSNAITLTKLSELNNDYRLFIATGKSIKPDRKLEGPQTDLVLDASLEKTMDLIFTEGIEHHYSIAHQNIMAELEELSKWMKWKVIKV
jgi:L-fucose isomerase-like protein